MTGASCPRCHDSANEMKEIEYETNRQLYVGI